MTEVTAPWVRTTVVLVALTGWVAAMAAYLIKGQLPEAWLVGMPTALLIALRTGRSRDKGADE